MASRNWGAPITLPRIDPSVPLPLPWASGMEMAPNVPVGDSSTHFGKAGELTSTNYVSPLQPGDQQIARPQVVRGLGSSVDAKFFFPPELVASVVQRLACQSSDKNWNKEFDYFKTFLQIFTGLEIKDVPGNLTYRNVTIVASTPDQVGFNFGHGGNTFDLSTGETRFISHIYANMVDYSLRNLDYSNGKEYFDQIVFNTVKSMNEYVLSILYQTLRGAPSLPHAMAQIRENEFKPFDELMETYEKTAFILNKKPLNYVAIFQMLYGKLMENLRKPIPSEINMFIPANGIVVGSNTFASTDYDKQGSQMQVAKNRAGTDEPENKEGVVICPVRQLTDPKSNQNVLKVSLFSGEYVLQQDPFATELGKYFAGSNTVEYISIDSCLGWIKDNLMVETDSKDDYRFMSRQEVEESQEGNLVSDEIFSPSQLKSLTGLFWNPAGEPLKKIGDIDDDYLPRSLLRTWFKSAADKHPGFYGRFSDDGDDDDGSAPPASGGAPTPGPAPSPSRKPAKTPEAPPTAPPTDTEPPPNTSTDKKTDTYPLSEGESGQGSAQSLWKLPSQVEITKIPSTGSPVTRDWMKKVYDNFQLDLSSVDLYSAWQTDVPVEIKKAEYFCNAVNQVLFVRNGQTFQISANATVKQVCDELSLDSGAVVKLFVQIKKLLNLTRKRDDAVSQDTIFLEYMTVFMLAKSTRISFAFYFRAFEAQSIVADLGPLLYAYLFKSRLPVIRSDYWRLTIDESDELDEATTILYEGLAKEYYALKDEVAIVTDLDSKDASAAEELFTTALKNTMSNEVTTSKLLQADNNPKLVEALISLWADNDIINLKGEKASYVRQGFPEWFSVVGATSPESAARKASKKGRKAVKAAPAAPAVGGGYSGGDLNDAIMSYLELPLTYNSLAFLLEIGAPLPYAVMLLSPLIMSEGDTAILTPRFPDYEVGRVYVSNPLMRTETSVRQLTLHTSCEAKILEGLFEPSVITQFPLVLHTGYPVADRPRLGKLENPARDDSQQTFDISVINAKSPQGKKTNILAALQPWGAPPGDGKSSWMTILGHYICPDSSPVKGRIHENLHGLNVPFGPFLASKIYDLPEQLRLFKQGPGSHGVFVPAFGLCRRVTSYEKVANQTVVHEDETMWPASFGTGSLRKRTSPGDDRYSGRTF